MTPMQTLAADISNELAATEPRRNIDHQFIGHLNGKANFPTVRCSINAQGLVLRADFDAASAEQIEAVSAHIAAINASRKQSIGNSPIAHMPERGR